MDDYRTQQAERRRQERIKRAKRKNLIIYIETFLILALSVALVIVSVGYFDLKKELNTLDQEQSSNISSVQSVISDGSPIGGDVDNSTAEWMRAEVNQWYMKLVNPDNKIDNTYINSIDRSKINTKYVVSATKETCLYLDTRIVEHFENMCKAAKDDGITLVSVSAFRSYTYQEGLYNNRVKRCQNEDGLSLEEAKKKAATIVARPGTSEHHLGLAIDINSVETSFENTKAFEWLQKNAEKYGFILRYPEDKQEITKIIYEPWHYRYVGVEHAKAINELGMCFEEYVEYLKSGGIKK